MLKETPRMLKGLWISLFILSDFLQMSKGYEINILSSRKWLNVIRAMELQKFLTSLYKSPLHKTEKTRFSLDQYLGAFL